MKALLGLVYIILILLPLPAHAGQIELGGKWYKFEELLVSGGPVVRGERNGLPQYDVGVLDPLLEKPARILMLSGSWRWSNVRLFERFWQVPDLALVLKSYNDGKQFLLLDHVLVEPYKVKGGISELRLTVHDRKKALDFFRTISDAAYEDNDDFKDQRCLEFLGRIGWSGNLKPTSPEWTYFFEVESVRVAGKIPRGWLANAPPVPTVDEATALCTPQQ